MQIGTKVIITRSDLAGERGTLKSQYHDGTTYVYNIEYGEEINGYCKPVIGLYAGQFRQI